MTRLATLMIVALFILVLANIVVSLLIARSLYYSSTQKFVQICITWLVPVLGVVAVGVFLYSQRDRPVFDTRAYPEPLAKAVPVEVEQAIHDHAQSD